MFNPHKKNVYSSQEAADKLGVSKLTLYRWFKSGKIKDVIKDYKNHRIFTVKDLQTIERFKSQVKKSESPSKAGDRKKWSRDFLSLAGSWKDDRNPEAIIADIYAARQEEKSSTDWFQ